MEFPEIKIIQILHPSRKLLKVFLKIVGGDALNKRNDEKLVYTCHSTYKSINLKSNLAKLKNN